MSFRSALWSATLVLGVGALFRCGGSELPAAPNVARKAAQRPLLAQSPVSSAAQPLAFPPAAHGRRARPALSSQQSRAAKQPQTIDPAADNDGTIMLQAKTLRIEFDRPMKGASAGAAAGQHLRVSPAVPGQARWEGPSTLAFVADSYLDPALLYSVELSGLAGADGVAMSPWTRKFATRTAGVVAGKTLSHKVTAGAPRAVAALPATGDVVTSLPRLRVLFDQPVSIEQARALIQLKDRDGKPVSLRFGHAPVGRFAGAAVDRRQVVVASASAALQAGAHYRLTASDSATLPEPGELSQGLSVAEPLALTDVECGWYTPRTEVCERAGDGSLTMSQRSVHFLFNNPLRVDSKRLRAHVQVTPFVRNLQIDEEGGWYQGRIALSGDFQPSMRYRVTIAGLRDRHGGRQRGILSQDIKVTPLGASVAMAEGFVALDEARTKSFSVTSRNVQSAQLELWRVADDDVSEFRAALRRMPANNLGVTRPSKVVPITIVPSRDKLVRTEIDLSGQLDKGASYLTALRLVEPAFGAQAQFYPQGSAASRMPIALLRVGDPNSLSAVVHSSASNTLVYVSRLRDGEPLADASVEVLPGATKVKTDANGMALLNVDTREAVDHVVRVSSGSEHLLMPLDQSKVTVDELFPELAGQPPPSGSRALVLTDRGIYRPGTTIHIKSSLFASERGKLTPQPGAVELHVLDSAGEVVCRLARSAGAVGGASADCLLPERARLGLYRIVLFGADRGTEFGETQVRVAAFEPPRFKVDVAATHTLQPNGVPLLKADVAGRYLFGSAMDGAQVEWSLKRTAAALPQSSLADAGLRFEPERSWADDEPAAERWARTGNATLSAKGELRLNQPLDIQGAVTPMRFTLQADVHDASNRHAAGRSSVVVHPASHYAGIRIQDSWLSVGEDLQIDLGAIDTAGQALKGATVTARLVKVDWQYLARRGPGGALDHQWRRTEKEIGRCAVTSDERPQRCSVKVTQAGDYQVISEVNGRKGGSSWLWAWGTHGNAASQAPSKGRVVQLVADKGRYRAGETARVLVRSPYPEAMALLSVDLGGVVSRQAKRVAGPAVVFDIPIEARFAPHVHAVVTLLPVAASGEVASGYRVGALRLPVADGGARLAIDVRSNKREYRPGEQVDITVKVSDQGKPDPSAEVVLAIVDEGVLRLTDFHAPDPLPQLRRPMPLAMALRSSRSGLAELFERSHVAGDGGGDESAGMTQTRRNFVQTALWQPDLHTNARGEVRVRFRLPDNLTEFRMMAVAVNREGKGGVEEASFTVNKPLMVEPIFPRFASAGDEVELAAMVHNNDSAPFDGSVDFAGQVVPVKVPGHGRVRVAVRMTPRQAKELALTLELKNQAGEVKDSAQHVLRVQRAGVLAHPQIDGSFRSEQRISLAIPAGVIMDPDAQLSIKTGPDLWPELGARVEYLLGYPHGCVEQTTSSTLPLLAARDILPRVGVDKHDDGYYQQRIAAGLKRLASMRTASGGLAYWPGGETPHLYGTAYAIRAVARAHQAEMALPAGLMEGMTQYLQTELSVADHSPSLRASIAESLAELHALPPHSADALYDLRPKLDLFGSASLALALSSLPGQQDRVASLLDDLEAGFDNQGVPRATGSDDVYWGSATRNQAQAVIALTRLRPQSRLVRTLAQRLARERPGYTTQSAAFSLLALADHLIAGDSQSAEVSASLAGVTLASSESVHGQLRFQLPLTELVGKNLELVLSSPADAVIGFSLDARYQLPLTAVTGASGAAFAAQQSSTNGPDIYRMITDPDGNAVDLSQLAVGQLLRVAVYARLPGGVPHDYLAITDPLPAGFAPVDSALASSASDDGVTDAHPLAAPLRRFRDDISHMEMHDDRVQIYFDRVGADEVAASYLVRATTRGNFAMPPSQAELMYQADSTSYGDPARVVVQ